jgi:alpha-glucosidase (family GH31 glycosyl hydrolase)
VHTIRLALVLVLVLVASGRAPAVETAQVLATQTVRSLRLSTGRVRAEVELAHYRLLLRDQGSGKVLAREVAGGSLFYERGEATHRLGTVRQVTLLADGARLTVDTDEGAPATVTLRFLTRRTLEVALEPPAPDTVSALGDRLVSPARERLYGLTERLRDSPPLAPGLIDIPADDVKPPEVGSLNRRGETVEMKIQPTFSVYAPFYQSSRGYGLSVAGTTFGVFDLAATDPATIRFRFEAGTQPLRGGLVFHLFAGPDYVPILDEYTSLNGRPIVPPAWAFLHWRWRGDLGSASGGLDDATVNAELADDVTMYDRLGIPPGVYLFDRPVIERIPAPDLLGEYGFSRWAWDEARLPNPSAMLQALTQRGYKLVIWSGTWMCGTRVDGRGSDNGIEAQTRGFLAPGSTGTPRCGDVGGTSFIMDVTNPGAQAWWRDRVAAFLQANGIQGIKLDRGEEHIASEASDVWADGRTGREVRNDYPRLQAKIHHDALAQAWGDDFVLLSRPSYTGTSRYSIFWGGDIPGSEAFGTGPGTDLGLRSAIISQQRAAFMGIPIWGSDTGGYYEFKDREVFARWLAFSAFSGIMEIGGTGRHAPWDMPTAPRVDQELIDIYRRFTQLRATLQPYIVAAAAQARTGVPLVRPMPFVDRHDRKLEDLWDQYLFGPDLLVAPVWKTGQRSRTVYLPRGTWRSYWDRTRTYRGRRTITVDVPLDSIPVFVRAGATVPGP